jgi:hypothetical protein
MPRPDEKKKDEEVVEEEVTIEDDVSSEDDVGEEIDIEDVDDKRLREEKERNKAFASMRVENKQLQEKLNQVQEQLSKIARPEPETKEQSNSGFPTTDEEWDALADKDWKKAVDLRANMNAQRVLAESKRTSEAQTVLEKSKQTVLIRHPELNDNNSEKAKIFLNILNENPDYINHPKGPIYAMRDMEDYMENTLGYKREDIAKRESERQNRIVLNQGGGKTIPSNKNTVTLTKDEAEFCKLQGIDPKEFAKTKLKLNKSGKEGVSL